MPASAVQGCCRHRRQYRQFRQYRWWAGLEDEDEDEDDDEDEDERGASSQAPRRHDGTR
ncbi:MAG: hypothetical protein ACOYD3_13055 [Kiritimatiellia bacterium]